MKKIFIFSILFCLFFITGCTGGRTQTPLEPPKPEDTPTPNPIGSTEWIRYENENKRGEVIFIYMYIQDQATLAYYPDYYNCYCGPFEWESSDGNTVYASKIKFDSNPYNYPTTGTLYNYKNINSSYIEYNGNRFVFNGYQASMF